MGLYSDLMDYEWDIPGYDYFSHGFSMALIEIGALPFLIMVIFQGYVK